MTIHAYDYREQRWVEGEPARQLQIQQLAQELALLYSERAAEYVAWIRRPGGPQTVAEFRHDREAAVDRLHDATA